MEQTAVPLDQRALTCSICLDLLKDPATLPCGHNYCMRCVQIHWDGEEERQIYSCPQCRQRFAPRPVLVKNTMLADLAEQMKKSGVQTTTVDLRPVGPGDVVCDVCSDKSLKAVKSCLQCVASYCETHLQPHHQSAALKQHQLVAPSEILQEVVCSEHKQVKKMFCRTDQQVLCVVCCMEQHKDHHTVLAANEVLHRIQEKESNLDRLQQEALDLRRSADEVVENSKKSFFKLICLMEKRWCEVEKQIHSQLKTEEARVKQLQDQLQQDITELRRTQAQLEALALRPDHYQFLQNYPSPSSAEMSPSIQPQSLGSFEQVTVAVSALTDLLQLNLTDGLDNISLTLTQELLRPQVPLPWPQVPLPKPQVPLPEPEPTTRADFLKYSREIILDPNTAHQALTMSRGNRGAEMDFRSYFRYSQRYPDHPERFSDYEQVLSKEGMMGRCYWEVEKDDAVIAVSYKDIERKGDSEECGFGYNDKSWAIDCKWSGFSFWFNSVESRMSCSVSKRIGVYVDHSAGVLSFFNINENMTMTLLHKVQATFTQPIYAGLRLAAHIGTGYFPKLK